MILFYFITFIHIVFISTACQALFASDFVYKSTNLVKHQSLFNERVVNYFLRKNVVYT